MGNHFLNILYNMKRLILSENLKIVAVTKMWAIHKDVSYTQECELHTRMWAIHKDVSYTQGRLMN
jgi:hypothetical protein